ncbi:sulfite exporter TauE/SafE family protein [Nitratireductor thuwali]|uniref:sulfite exporter TauE/SafE family protein n=1 Tax=Nitratireductor thuwali TaxID=2267699 RepID=UPI0030CEC92C
MIGSLASAVFGFGTALLVLAIGSHVLPIKEVIVLATVLFAASTTTKTVLFGRQIEWKVVAIMAIASLPFAYLGAQALAVVPADHIKRLLGLMILIYIVLTACKLLPSFRIGTAGLLVGSALYGFISGFLGSGNLVKVVIFRELKFTKEAFVGAMAATSVLSNFAKLASYWQTGLLTAEMVWPALALVVSAIVAAVIGQMILNKLNASAFETGVQVLLGVSAVTLLI